MVIPYVTNIESHIISQIESAKLSIHIAVAWFTNKRIINALFRQLEEVLELTVQIVVDDNETNRLHFFNRAEAMRKAGMIIRQKANRQFLHHKFIIIDQIRVMVGSYNFTEKANSNRENFNLVDDQLLQAFSSGNLKYSLTGCLLMKTFFCYFAIRNLPKRL